MIIASFTSPQPIGLFNRPHQSFSWPFHVFVNKIRMSHFSWKHLFHASFITLLVTLLTSRIHVPSRQRKLYQSLVSYNTCYVIVAAFTRLFKREERKRNCLSTRFTCCSRSCGFRYFVCQWTWSCASLFGRFAYRNNKLQSFLNLSLCLGDSCEKYSHARSKFKLIVSHTYSLLCWVNISM